MGVIITITPCQKTLGIGTERLLIIPEVEQQEQSDCGRVVGDAESVSLPFSWSQMICYALLMTDSVWLLIG